MPNKFNLVEHGLIANNFNLNFFFQCVPLLSMSKLGLIEIANEHFVCIWYSVQISKWNSKNLYYLLFISYLFSVNPKKWLILFPTMNNCVLEETEWQRKKRSFHFWWAFATHLTLEARWQYETVLCRAVAIHKIRQRVGKKSFYEHFIFNLPRHEDFYYRKDVTTVTRHIEIYNSLSCWLLNALRVFS